MNRIVLQGVLATLVASLAAGAIAWADAPSVAPAAAAMAAAPHQIIVAGVAADSATPPRNCDAAHPVEGDFDFSEVRHAQADGITAQVITGVVTNRCAQPAKNVAVEADASAGGIGVALIGSYLYSGVLAPGQFAPFTFALAAGSPNIDQLTFRVLPYSQPVGAVPALRVTSLQPTSTADGLRYSYSVTNSGTGPATLPRIAARLTGLGCDNPFTFESVNFSNQILPGETVTGQLAIPGSCGGTPELFPGSDGPLDASVPAGWSVQGAQVTYTSDGVMHLLAMLCNNNGANFYLFPAVRLRFTGSQTTTADVYDTNYYPSQACRPLIASFPDAPAGLVFNSLVAIDTGEGFQAVPALTAAAQPQPVAAANRDLAFALTLWVYGEIARAIPPGGFGRQVAATGPIAISYDQANALPDVRSSAAADQGDLLALLYNPDDVAHGAADQILLATGTNATGDVTAGIAVTDLPTVAPNAWALLDVPLDGPDVIRVPGTSTTFGSLAATRPAVSGTGP